MDEDERLRTSEAVLRKLLDIETGGGWVGLREGLEPTLTVDQTVELTQAEADHVAELRAAIEWER